MEGSHFQPQCNAGICLHFTIAAVIFEATKIAASGSQRN